MTSSFPSSPCSTIKIKVGDKIFPNYHMVTTFFSFPSAKFPRLRRMFHEYHNFLTSTHQCRFPPTKT